MNLNLELTLALTLKNIVLYLDVCAAIAKPTAYWVIYNLYICEINLADSVVDTQLFVVEVFLIKM